MKISYELMLLLMEKLGTFTKQEELNEENLSTITDLRLQGIDSLEGIEYLKKLKKLSICSYEYSKLTWDVDITFNPYINKIQDFSPLTELTQLETLIISNDLYLEKLDISRLVHLKYLCIMNNPRLSEIKGLDQLQELEMVIIYGNHIQQEINMEQYLKNTKLVTKNILDIDFYIHSVNHDYYLSDTICNAFFKGETNILFAEPSGLLEFTTTHPIQLQEMYKKLFSYFKKEKVFAMPYEEQIQFVYQYITKNTKFNNEELQERNEKYQQLHSKDRENLKINLTFLHNGYTTYHLKSGNCEGRINLMHFMLEMLGISSKNVHCIDRRAAVLSPNHAMLRIDNELKYIDPSYQRTNSLNLYDFYMKDCYELDKTHILNVFEKILEDERLTKQEESEEDEKHFKRIIRR